MKCEKDKMSKLASAFWPPSSSADATADATFIASIAFMGSAQLILLEACFSKLGDEQFSGCNSRRNVHCQHSLLGSAKLILVEAYSSILAAEKFKERESVLNVHYQHSLLGSAQLIPR